MAFSGRFAILQATSRRWWVRSLLILWTVISSWNTIRGELLPESWADRLPNTFGIGLTIAKPVPFTAWLLGVAGIFVIGAIEYAHRRSSSGSSTLVAPNSKRGDASAVLDTPASKVGDALLGKPDGPAIRPDVATAAETSRDRRLFVRAQAKLLEQENRRREIELAAGRRANDGPSFINQESIELAGVVNALMERALRRDFKIPLPPGDSFLVNHQDLENSTHPIWTRREVNQLRRDFLHFCGIVGSDLRLSATEHESDSKELAQFGQQLIAELTGIKATEPSPSAGQRQCSLFIKSDGRYWWLEISNQGVDAEFFAMLDFADTEIFRKPPAPVRAEWSGGSADKSRLIPQGSRDMIFLHGVESSYGAPILTDEFRWVSEQGRETGHGYSWSYLSEPKIEPPKHRLKIVVSAKPPLADGSKVVVVDIEGSDLRIISGDVASE